MFYYEDEDRDIVKFVTKSLPLVDTLCLFNFGFITVELISVDSSTSEQNRSYTLQIKQHNEGFIKYYSFLNDLFSLTTIHEMKNHCKDYPERDIRTERSLKEGMRDQMKIAYSLLQDQSYELLYLVMDMIFRLSEYPSYNHLFSIIDIAADILGIEINIRKLYRKTKKLVDIEGEFVNMRDTIIKEFEGIIYPSHLFPYRNSKITSRKFRDKVFVIKEYPLTKQQKKTITSQSIEWKSNGSS